MTSINFKNENRNSAKNFNSFTIGDVTFYISYSTIVAVYIRFEGMYISKNYWSSTTGKHLNWLNRDKSVRLDSEEFQKILDNIDVDINIKKEMLP